MAKTYIISHAEDVDGISSAAIALAANPGAKFKLVDYTTLIKALSKIPSGVTDLVICDLGASSVFSEFTVALKNLSRRMAITYIDHHPLKPEQIQTLRDIGINTVHDTTESASTLTYFAFNLKGSSQYYLPIYGAVTDYMDNGPRAAELIDRVHRHFALLEATLLSSAIAQGATLQYRNHIVRELAVGKYPHEIKTVVRNAAITLRKDVKLTSYVEQHRVITGKVASIAMPEGRSIPASAKILLGAPGIVAGVAYEQKTRGKTVMSLRGIRSCPVHLGDFIGDFTQKTGGRGGGHRLAAGAKVPVNKVPAVITQLSLKLGDD